LTFTRIIDRDNSHFDTATDTVTDLTNIKRGRKTNSELQDATLHS